MRIVVFGLCLAFLAGCTTPQARPSEPMVWRRVVSPYGLPVWIPVSDLEKATSARSPTRVIRVLVPHPQSLPPGVAAGDYLILRETYRCDQSLMKSQESVYLADGGLVHEEPEWPSFSDIIPGISAVTRAQILCDGVAVGGPTVELNSIAEVLAYPIPQAPPPHP